ncbi:alpha-amylase [Mycena vulgaris]|nr:alpha-amylase [Mycena vulgaris]
MFLSFILASLLLASPTLAASAQDWSTRSIYQLVTDRFATSTDSATPCDTALRTYCGGSWAGIASHLDYIQDMGFDAIWISPIVKNADNTSYGDGYHGYWSQDIDTISPHFGTPDDLKALSAALHARGMYLMLDVVINHFAGVPTNTTVSDSNRFTFNFSSLLPFATEADFHVQCFINDFHNQTEVEQCWLGDENLPLPDINTEDDAIVEKLLKWVKDTVTEFDLDGVRIDTVKHIRHDFWNNFTANAGVFTLGEVLTDNVTYASSYIGHVDAVLEYPAWYQLITAFASTGGNLSAIEASPALTSSFSSSSSSAVLTAAFLENHDQPRFRSYTTDLALTKNAMAWPFVGDGMPILYYGQEQGYGGGPDPENREALWLSGYETNKPLITHVKALNAVRKLAIAANASFLMPNARWLPQPNPSAIALSKPPLLTLFTNIGATAPIQPTWSIPEGLYAPGTELVDVLDCTPLIIDASGTTVVGAKSGLPQVLIPASMLSKVGNGTVCVDMATGASSGAPRGQALSGLAVLAAALAVGVALR